MKNEKIVERLAQCVLACNECHDACLHEKMLGMMTECIRLDKDCAAVCTAALQLTHLGSHLIKPMFELCAKACDACAAECEKHDNEHCRACAKACRQCAEAMRS